MAPATYAADVGRDLRGAVRQVTRHPGFAGIAILTLAVGIGANAAFFSLVKAVLLRPLAADGADRLVRLYTRTSAGGSVPGFSYADYAQLSERTRTLAPIAAVHLATISLAADRQRDQLLGEIASASYFEILGMRPAVGRMLGPEDDRRDATPAAVLAHRYWRLRFGGDAGVIGRTVFINNRAYTIAGVAEERAMGSFIGAPVDVWIALEPSLSLLGPAAATDRSRRVLQLIARLAPQAAAATPAQSELQIVAPEVARARSERGEFHLELGPGTLLHGPRRAVAAGFLSAMMGLVGLVLIVSAANVANLLLARALARRRELALRMALGAGRTRLIRQLLAESALLAGLGGAAGLLAARWATGAFSAIALLPGFELRLDLSPDPRVVAFTAAATLVAAFAAGLAPALSAARAAPLTALQEGRGAGGSRRTTRLRDGLVIAQVAVSVVLLVAAGLLAKSARSAADVDLGFDTARAFATDLDLQAHGYDESRGRVFYRQLIDRVLALPDVASASLANRAPLDSSTPTARVARPGAAGRDTSAGVETTYYVVGPQYFDTIRTTMMTGRAFDRRDRDAAPQTVVVNETLARRLWPDEPPAQAVGRRLEILPETATERRAISGTFDVVGVARDAKYRTIGEDPQPHMYLPFEQHYIPSMTLLVRSRVAAVPAIAVQEQIAALDPAVQGFFTRTLAQHTAVARVPVQLGAAIARAAGLVALLLGAIGLYGVIACIVAERTRELGVRKALGATGGTIAIAVVGRSVRVAAVGCICGLALAIGAGHGIAGLLYGVSPIDPAVYAIVPLALLCVAVVAAAVPAWRAATVDPVVALRAE